MSGGYASYDFGMGQQAPQRRQRLAHHQQAGPCSEGGYDPSVAAAFSPAGAFLPPHAYLPAGALDHFASQAHILQQQQQQQAQVAAIPMSMPSSMKNDHFTPLMAPSMPAFAPPTSSMVAQADPAMPANDDSWLDTLQIEVSGISLEPLSGSAILKRVRDKTDNVVTRYLPCVEFLVNCQQELRAGLANATQKRLVRHAYRDNMTPRQFYNRYLAPLVERFHRRNQHLMENASLTKATQEIQKLLQTCKNISTCEGMKNQFLGGMRDGQSWGLRKWLSTHGGALHICNDLECILHACQKLSRDQETTLKLSERLRPLAQQALSRLKSDVPASYQEHSTAHPYLPFFHRLESALKGMANFDPEDDDVICIDDEDEIEIVKQKASSTAKRPAASVVDDSIVVPVAKRTKVAEDDEFTKKTDSLADDPILADFGRFGTPPIKNPLDDSDSDDSVIEIINVVKPQDFQNDHWRCSRCTMLNLVCSQRCCMCSKARENEESCAGVVGESVSDVLEGFSELAGLPSFEAGDQTGPLAAKIFDIPSSPAESDEPQEQEQQFALPPAMATLENTSNRPLPPPDTMSATEMTTHLEHMAYLFEVSKQNLVRPEAFHCESFWDSSETYPYILRLLVSIIRSPDAHLFLNPVESWIVMGRPTYSDWIKHPLCFRDIIHALVNLDQASDGATDDQPSGTGVLHVQGLERWNMWRGFDLLQAIDLVFLNTLAFNGKTKTTERSQANRMRKLLWDEIHRITFVNFGTNAEERKKVTPTRRGETSGFVICKP